MKDKCNMRKYEEKIYSLLYALYSLKQIRNNNDSTKFEFCSYSITFRL